MHINHSEMVAALAKPGKDIIATLTAEQAHLWHMATGIAGESMELVLAAMKDDKENMLEELGDLEFYIKGMEQGLGIVLVSYEDEAELIEDFGYKYPMEILIQAHEVFDRTKRVAIYQDLSKVNDVAQHLQTLRNYVDSYYALTDGEHTKEKALAHNIEKLGERYKAGNYSDNAANARADKGGKL